MSRLAPAVLLSLSALACSGVSSQAYTLDGALPFRGHVTCGEATCDPGDHCENPVFSACQPGCLTDENCAPALECALPAGSMSGTKTCQQPVPGIKEGEECATTDQCASTLYCFFAPSDSKGTCRAKCSRSYDCSSLTGRYGDDCCKVTGVSLSVCVPDAVAPSDCTGF